MDANSGLNGPALVQSLRGWRDFIGTRLNHPEECVTELRVNRQAFMDALQAAAAELDEVWDAVGELLDTDLDQSIEMSPMEQQTHREMVTLHKTPVVTETANPKENGHGVSFTTG